MQQGSLKKVIAMAAAGLTLMILGACTDVVVRPGVSGQLSGHMAKIAIPTFQNRTGQPNLENEITQQLTRDFLVDGRLELTNPDQAGAILQGTIVQYLLTPLLLDVHNTPQQYKMRIIMHLSLKDTQAGKSLWTEDNWEENTTYYVNNSLGIRPETEQDARRRLITQLSRRIVSRVIEGF